MKVVVSATLKPDVLDPQGEAIRKACNMLGYDAISGVRQGKLFEVDIDISDKEDALRLIEEIGEKLLANTVIETCRVERVEI